MNVDFGDNNDAIAAFNNDHAKDMLKHYFEKYFFHTYQDSDPIIINTITYNQNDHSITFLVKKGFKDKLGVDAEDIRLELDVRVQDLENDVLFFKNFVSYVLKDPLARLDQFSFTDNNNNIDHEVSFYRDPDRIEVNEVN
jgi:hypothetical protein